MLDAHGGATMVEAVRLRHAHGAARANLDFGSALTTQDQWERCDPKRGAQGETVHPERLNL